MPIGQTTALARRCRCEARRLARTGHPRPGSAQVPTQCEDRGRGANSAHPHTGALARRAPTREPARALRRGQARAKPAPVGGWLDASPRRVLRLPRAQPRGWEGVGPQAVGCGLLLGSRGHPIPFAVIAQQAPCGRCTGRPAGAKRKRASPCGLALFEVRTLSRAALVGAPLPYHNQPLLSRPAVQFFGCR